LEIKNFKSQVKVIKTKTYNQTVVHNEFLSRFKTNTNISCKARRIHSKFNKHESHLRRSHSNVKRLNKPVLVRAFIREITRQSE